jgi:hypothetical protein
VSGMRLVAWRITRDEFWEPPTSDWSYGETFALMFGFFLHRYYKRKEARHD